MVAYATLCGTEGNVCAAYPVCDGDYRELQRIVVGPDGVVARVPGGESAFPQSAFPDGYRDPGQKVIDGVVGSYWLRQVGALGVCQTPGGQHFTYDAVMLRGKEIKNQEGIKELKAQGPALDEFLLVAGLVIVVGGIGLFLEALSLMLPLAPSAQHPPA